MTEKLHFAYLASSIIETYYIKLRELSYQNEEDSPEYADIINKLKKATQGESKIYNELTESDLAETIKYFDKKSPQNVTEVRMKSKLNQIYRRRHTTETYTNLGNAITTKMVIDVLKKVTFKILKLKVLDSPDEDIEALLLYNDLYKYNYLTGNEYIEKIALEYNFDILSLPNIKFDDIESTFKIEFIKNSANITLNYIKESIEELLNFESDDQQLNTYITLFEISRIEVMLPYLSKDMLINLSNYLGNLNNKRKDDILIKIKKIIDKRKEEFE